MATTEAIASSLGSESIKRSLAGLAGSRSAFILKPVNRRDLLNALADAMVKVQAPVTFEAEVLSLSSAASAPMPALPAPAPMQGPALVPVPPAEMAAPAPDTTAPPAGRSSFAQEHPARILLVEDQPVNQKLAKLMLAKLGYQEVDLAENGAVAVEMTMRGNYDLILMDLQMPVMGGEDAARHIRANFNLQRQPVIVAVTGHALSGVRESCKEVGMDQFMTKPVSLDDLRRMLGENIKSHVALAS